MCLLKCCRVSLWSSLKSLSESVSNPPTAPAADPAYETSRKPRNIRTPTTPLKKYEGREEPISAEDVPETSVIVARMREVWRARNEREHEELIKDIEDYLEALRRPRR